ncbi:MAG: class I SAM-dependent methyltransferase [Candidatus Scalindua sp.]|nr:class I SAM-dependent methyltransferase [Candidatus Scalindua sp.]
MKLPLPTIPEPTNAEYSCFNTGSVEVEVADFLYGFIRMIKPTAILETGTHKGISAIYMAEALKDNNKGKITTVEYEPTHYHEAVALFHVLHLSDWINPILQDVNTLQVADNQYDFIFLDTEPHLRFGEFCRFWHGLKPGGFIGIHDLSEGMGQTGKEVNGMMDWPFGTMPTEMRSILRNEVQSFHFNTPRGFFLGQKKKEGFFQP